MRADSAFRFFLLLFATAHAASAAAGQEQPIFIDGFESGCAQVVGMACDGTDSDHCPTGTYACVNDIPVCSDDATSTVDLCNNLDDDCDAASADGSEDPQIGGKCDGGDTDMCPEGMQQCVTGAPVCSDTSGNNVEVCNGNDDDCDTQVDEGTRDTNPMCDTATNMGSLSGDSGTPLFQASGLEEWWYRFRMTENDTGISSIYLSATVSLNSPVGADFDLFVYCLSCGGTLAGSSTISNLAGHFDVVNVRADDEFGVIDDIDLLVEIRYKSGPSCSFWNLAVNGNTTANSPTCP